MLEVYLQLQNTTLPAIWHVGYYQYWSDLCIFYDPDTQVNVTNNDTPIAPFFHSGHTLGHSPYYVAKQPILRLSVIYSVLQNCICVVIKPFVLNHALEKKQWGI